MFEPRHLCEDETSVWSPFPLLQVIRVRAPWIQNYFNLDGEFYVIPNFDTIVLGGTAQVRCAVTSPICLSVCLSIRPSLRVCASHLSVATC
jgi:hypothetical protein